MPSQKLDEGRVAELVVNEGTDDVAVGTVIARLTGEREHAADIMTDMGISQPLPVKAEAELAQRRALADRSQISPLAARIAYANGLDLTNVAGTGANGRIVRADLRMRPLLAIPGPTDPMAPAASIAIAPTQMAAPETNLLRSTMGNTVSCRMAERDAGAPNYYLTVRCNLDPLMAVRCQLNETLVGSGTELSVNDLLIKAFVLALCDVPNAHVQFAGDLLHRFGRVDISMAVATDNGTVAPVLRDAGSLSLSAIARQTKALITKARDGKLTSEDCEGGTVSLSNLGMLGIDTMFPSINPPQALILGIAAGFIQPWKVDGEIGLASVMAATASFDLRAIDESTGAQFMQSFRDGVENPVRLLA